MKRIVLAVAILLLTLPELAACSGHAGEKRGAIAPPAQGKPQAPVEVTAQLAAGRAAVTVTFRSAASDVSVQVHGVDGLTVTSAAQPISGGEFAAGESVTLDVTFTEGAGRSHLAVGVSGTFGSAARSAVASFAVGQPTAEQQKATGETTTDSTGRRIKVLPAQTR
jgi:hypothetical protein